MYLTKLFKLQDANRLVVQNAPPQKAQLLLTKTDVRAVPIQQPQAAITAVTPLPPVLNVTKKQRQSQQLHVQQQTMPPFKPIPASAIDPKLIIGNSIRQNLSTATRVRPAMTVTHAHDPIPAFHAMPPSVVQAYTAAQNSDPVEQKQPLPSANLYQRVINTHNNISSSHLNMAGLSPAEADIIARKQALKKKQAMILAQQSAAALTTTTTTSAAPIEYVTPLSPVRTGVAASSTKYMASKVMNAPKEYYPVGYDKNFDDNFVSRVELPETSFYCGDQKHFPGLYADEDLGCMVSKYYMFRSSLLLRWRFCVRCEDKCNWAVTMGLVLLECIKCTLIPRTKIFTLLGCWQYFVG